jgi:hypothetical protein
MSIFRYVTQGRNASGHNFRGTCCETEEMWLCLHIEVLLCLSYVLKCESVVKLNVDRNRVVRKTWNGAEQGKLELTFTAWKWGLETRQPLQMWARTVSVIHVCDSIHRRKNVPLKQAGSYHALRNKISCRLYNLAPHLFQHFFSYLLLWLPE